MDVRGLEDWKKLIIIIGAASLLAMIITIIAVLASGPSGEQADERVTDPERDRPIMGTIEEFRLTPQGFMFPPVVEEIWYGSYSPLRERKLQWGMEEFSRFYYDPREIGSENLRKQNRKLIDNLLEETP